MDPMSAYQTQRSKRLVEPQTSLMRQGLDDGRELENRTHKQLHMQTVPTIPSPNTYAMLRPYPPTRSRDPLELKNRCIW